MASSPAILTMRHFVVWKGVFPSRSGDEWPAVFNQGMIQTFAGTIQPFGAPPALGQHVSIGSAHMLFALYGTNFGGNGRDQFCLPNLENRIAIGGSPVGAKGEQTLNVSYLIAAGKSVVPFPGTIIAFGGDFVPDGWLAADGRLLPVSSNRALFDAIGKTYGGDGATDFALPNLNGAAPVGAGRGRDLPAVELGQKVSGTVPGLGLNFVISTGGIYPPTDGEGELPYRESYYGQVVAYAGSRVPSGWALCDGALLPIRTNMPLFSIIGNAYGGDQQVSFALPDLRGRMLAGPDRG